MFFSFICLSLDLLNKLHSVIAPNIVLISRAFRHQFIVPDFANFTKEIEDIYWKCKSNADGKVASYIPQLARMNPDYWGVSVCTVDGQRFSIGDVNIPFTLQSCSKPLTYAIALEKLGQEVVGGSVKYKSPIKPTHECAVCLCEWVDKDWVAGARALPFISIYFCIS